MDRVEGVYWKSVLIKRACITHAEVEVGLCGSVAGFYMNKKIHEKSSV